MSIPKHIQKYIEGELFNYPVNKKTLAQFKQNVYLQQSACGYVVSSSRSTYPSSSVESKVMSIMSDRYIIYLENSVKIVEDVMSELSEEYKKLIELRYFKSCSPQKVAGELSICERNFFNWRNKAIRFFALRFGVI